MYSPQNRTQIKSSLNHRTNVLYNSLAKLNRKKVLIWNFVKEKTCSTLTDFLPGRNFGLFSKQMIGLQESLMISLNESRKKSRISSTRKNSSTQHGMRSAISAVRSLLRDVMRRTIPVRCSSTESATTSAVRLQIL